MSDETLTVKLVASGEVQTLPYRRAVSLLSRQLAVPATPLSVEPEEPTVPEDDKDAKSVKETKNTLSTPARKGQEGVNAENKPLSDE